MSNLPNRNVTLAADRVPTIKKLAWSIGAIFENMMANGIGTLVSPIFIIGYGIPAVWIGWGQTIPRVIDAVVDPILGWLSDKTRTRWGRRRPWMFIGGLLGSFSFTLIWFADPHWSKLAVFLWFLVVSILYYVSYGIYAISYNALGMELSPDYQERTRIQAWRFVFLNVSGQLLSWAYKLSLIPIFAIGMSVGVEHTEVYGMRGVGVVFGLIMLVCSWVPIFFLRENPADEFKETATSPKKEDPSLLVAVRETFENKTFVLFMGILTFGILGAFVLPFQTYLNIYYIFDGNKAAAATFIGVNATFGMVISFVAAPFIAWVASRLGKRGTLLLGQVIMVPSAVLTWFLYNPRLPYLQLIIWFLSVLGLPALLVLYNSIVADIADLDEMKTGQRREGMYGAVTAFVMKVIISVTTVVTGYTLAAAGFNETLPQQAPHTLRAMHLWIVFWPAVMAAFTAGLLVLFPLTRRKAEQVRRILEKRRGRRTVILNSQVTYEESRL